MTYPTVNGVPLDQIFDPYVTGTKAALTGYTVKIAGVATDLRDLFAPIYLGTSAAATKYRVNNADLNTIFAKKGSVQYALGFNGQSYTSNRGRSAASLTLNMKSDGTWSVVKEQGFSGETLLASGSWLNFGGSVSDYTVKFVMDGFTVGPDAGGGYDNFSNDAPTPMALTTTRSADASAVAVTVGNYANNEGSVTALLYKSGVLISTSACDFSCTSSG